MADGGMLPRAGLDGWDDGVIYKGRAYRREHDSLAYERVDYYLNRSTPSYPNRLRERYLEKGIVLP